MGVGVSWVVKLMEKLKMIIQAIQSAFLMMARLSRLALNTMMAMVINLVM